MSDDIGRWGPNVQKPRRRGVAVSRKLRGPGNRVSMQREEAERQKRFKRREMEDLQFWIDIGWRP